MIRELSHWQVHFWSFANMKTKFPQIYQNPWFKLFLKYYCFLYRATRGKPRPPITVPGVRTTFKVHCPSSGPMSVRFELLKQRPHYYPSPRYKDNSPSGIFFYTNGYRYLSAKRYSYERFRLHRWRGTIVGIHVLNTGHWLGYSNTIKNGELHVRHSNRRIAQHPQPAIYDTFTIESGMYI